MKQNTQHVMTLTRYFLCIFLSIFVLPAHAATNSQALSALNNRISHTQAQLKLAKQQRTHVQDKLRQAEVNSGLMQIQLNQTQKQVDKQKTALTQLEQKEQDIKIHLSQQQNQLAQQLRTLYMLGNQPHLKLLLNQNSIKKTNRITMYLQYLNQQRSNDIAHIKKLLAQLKLNQQQLQQRYQHLRNTLKIQEQQTQQYQTLRHQRSKLINKINNTIQTHQQKLTVLGQNKQKFESTIHQLNQKSGIKSYPGVHFSKLRGRLHWPSQGRILNMFGHNIQGSQLTWDGILIRTSENHPVYAIADGEVIFAKWLAGYGLLLIVNQGHGYMTLYGRVHSLYKVAGQHVRAGEQIATVGESGGFTQPALYFAIRHNAEPLDPVHWCRR